MALLMRLLREDDGLETLEWAVLAAVFVGAAVAGYTLLANGLNTALNTMGADLAGASGNVIP